METTSHRIVEGQYLRDILDQPRAMAATLEGLKISGGLRTLGGRLREGLFKRVVLTGMGASFHALHPVFLKLNAHGYTAAAVETSELVHSVESWLAPETLIVAVSQSGESAEIVRLLESNGRRAAIIGVTNAAASGLARGAAAAMVTRAGEEFSVSCKTYVTALMALHMLGAFFCGVNNDDERRTREELAEAVSAVASYFEGWRERVYGIAAELGRVRNLFLLGRGESLAACGAGALIVKESVRLHAEGMSGAAFRHGPLEMAGEETFAVVFAGADPTKALQVRLADDIRQAGGGIGWVAEGGGPWSLPTVSPAMRPILEILPVQMMTVALAAEMGIEAGRFARVSKITATE